MSIRGVIAGGSEPTVAAGAQILAAGGNAIDAAVGACFATSVGEPTLTSLAGGGMLLYRDAETGEATMCDFFADTPRLTLAELDAPDFFGIDLDFGPTTQRFYVGAGAAAVPTVLQGLCTALERWGSLSLEEVALPACRLAREGATLGPYQGRAAKLLEPILTHTESGRGVFHLDGRMIRSGDNFRLPALADTLETMARMGWQRWHAEVFHPQVAEQFGPARGGLLTRDDLDAYRVAFREPLTRRYHHSRVLTPGPPAAGGPMIALMLALLDSVQLGKRDPRGAEHAKLLCCAMAVADEARKEGARALDRIDHWLARFATLTKADGLPAPPTRPGPSATTHISVLDGAGNAASVTFSYGEGNAHIIGDTGIMMNNLMGEEDLFPDGFDAAPRAQRLATMMSPTLLLDDAGGITVLGTGGANRIRTAIVQVLSLLHDHGYACEPAVHAARIHYEAGVLNAEVFDLPDRGEALLALGANKTVRFDEPSLFFGGVHMVRRGADGTLSGAGDPRRGGVFRIVT